MADINYGPGKDVLSLVNAVGFVVLLVLMGVAFGLVTLQRWGGRVGPVEIHPSEETRDVLWGLLIAIIGPFVIVSGAAHYILQAGIGNYSLADDFRNSQTFVNACWIFMLIAAPLFALGGLLFSGEAFRRRQRVKSRLQEPMDPVAHDDRHRRHHHSKHRKFE